MFPVDFICKQSFFLLSELLYNLTADVDKRQKNQPSRIYFTQAGSQVTQLSQQLSLDINREKCQQYTAYVKVRGSFWSESPLFVRSADISATFPLQGLVQIR